MGRKLLGSSRKLSTGRLHVHHPLTMASALTVAVRQPAILKVQRAEAVALAFDPPAEKVIPIPPGACAQFGQEVTTPCPATCQWVQACAAAFEEASR